MNLDIDKDWFAKKAAEEGDLEIGAGMRKTLTVDLTQEEIALLERLIDPAKADMRTRIAALEAENDRLRKALEACPLPSAMGNSATHYAKFYDWFNAHVVPALEAKP